MTDSLLYFAYGSNMSLRRIKARIDSARPVASASLVGHVLRFHKKGMDGSGKCDAFHTGNPTDLLQGMCFDIAPGDRLVLDRYEGVGNGYEHKNVSLTLGGRVATALTYVATDVEDGLHPWDWYLHHVVTGAQEAGLTQHWITQIECIRALPDPDRGRAEREMEIYRQAE